VKLSILALVGAIACHGDSRPAPSVALVRRDAAAKAIDAPAIDAPVGERPCGAAEAASHKFRFGTLTAPTGWCWRRTAEGDDQSGVVVDADARIRFRYFELSFDEKLGDSCDVHRPGVHGIHDAGTGRTCQLDDGRHCASFHGVANICTVAPEAAGFSLDELIATKR
jgi:hypothetical protein